MYEHKEGGAIAPDKLVFKFNISLLFQNIQNRYSENFITFHNTNTQYKCTHKLKYMYTHMFAWLQ